MIPRVLICIALISCCKVVSGDEDSLMKAFLAATPLHPTVRTPDVPTPDTVQEKIAHEAFTTRFRPYEGCSMNMSDLKPGDFGTVSTPNYPRNYPARTSCEWYLESQPGTKIEATFFDVVTQPWFFTYFDYIMVSRDGNFTNVDKISGDMNRKTPMTMDSEKNQFGIRFTSSTLFNFRGMKMQYLVKSEEHVQESEPSVFDGVCGVSSALVEATTEHPTSSPVDEVTQGEGETASDKPSDSDVPILVPGAPSTDAPSTDENEIEEDDSKNKKSSLDDRIIGDLEAPRGAFPWMVALLIDGRHFCGGSLIDDQHVVTAAHCTDGARNIAMLLGAHNIRAPSSQEVGRMIVNVTSDDIFQHPDYNSNTISHDITVIKMPNKIAFTDGIKPLCIPNRYMLSKIFAGEPVRVSGWGKTSDGASSVSPILKYVDLSVMSNSQCRSYFRGIVTGNLICTATKTNASPCRGDSGSPLIVKQRATSGEEYFMQIGVVSFGSNSCQKAAPVGFTRVTAFVDYIASVTGRDL